MSRSGSTLTIATSIREPSSPSAVFARATFDIVVGQKSGQFV